ncbi:MAG: DNA-protecting protein DprA [Bifidobacteriaceae bacterium]|jgi:DNA processing protein|nr:DNA-protecting protein DprA [Bifidobacteriaceae bacterium]
MSQIQLPFDTDNPVLARAAWSRLIEPGDRDAGALLAIVQPGVALRAVAEGVAVDEWRGIVGPKAAARALQRWRPRLEKLDPRRELRALESFGGTFLSPDHPGWPEGLGDLGLECPVALWVWAPPEVAAQLGALLRPGVALVGSRASTAYGETVTAQMVTDLVGHGLAIVSGGAFGIDATAHRACLALGGFTVAVMAGGVDRLYPLANESLLRSITEHGAVISELPPGSAPRRERFLSRNRLIAALGSATVVTESNWRSGSHRTARAAAALMRPVGAVPGPVTSASSAGCHKLVREGVATLVTGADEVRELVAPLGEVCLIEPDVGRGPLDGLAAPERQVFDSLPARQAATLTAIVTASGMSTPQVLAALGRLERAGRAAQAGGLWRRVNTTKAAA